MPSDLALKTINVVHRAILKISGGRVGARAAGMPVVQLTTIGRKSGQRRTVMLTSPARVGDALVVVASRGGDNRHPAWFLNLENDPHVHVAVQGGPSRPMLARVATTQERDELWPKIAGQYTNYAGYQTKTSRVIPLVLLEPQA